MADKTYSGVPPLAVDAAGIRFVKNIMATTHDGTQLAMNNPVPVGKGPWPGNPHQHSVSQGRPAAAYRHAATLGAARLRRRAWTVESPAPAKA